MKKEYYAAEQISLKKYIDSFPGSEKKKAKKTAAGERLFEIEMRC